jgi:Patatin-like phospholipase
MPEQAIEPSRRDRHLFGPGPKRILSLDGGGVRGAISIGFLERLEQIVSEIEGRPTLLGDWFDLIGGTSTGAIIASALALGYRAKDIHHFYHELAHRVFRRPLWRVAGVLSKFDRRRLMHELDAVLATRTLDSDDLHTGLGIVTKRLDTGSCWFLANNPKSMFWDDPPDGAYLGNKHYRLTHLVRASAAAPHYFDPELIHIVDREPPGLFIDGGLTPHNNPALHLLLYAALPQYGLAWPLGADKLTIVSIGTGYSRPRVGLRELRWIRPIGMAIRALGAQVAESQQLVLTLMSWLGETPTAWPINMELGDVAGVPAPFGQPLFRFLRYDIRIEQDWLARELGVTLDARRVAHYRLLDAPKNIPAIYELGAKAAARQIKREHLAPVIGA